MNNMSTLLVMVGLGLCANLPAQEPGAMKPRAVAESTKGVEQWIADLGSDSYKTRLQAEKALRELGQAAVPALKKAAEEPAEVEVQWRARRLLRQLEKGANQGLVERGKSKQGAEPQGDETRRDELRRSPFWRAQGGLPDAMREQFESLFEGFERDLGLDVPRARFFQDDFFRDLQEQMKSGGGTQKGMSMQIGPDGAVRVEIDEKNEKGEIEKKVYEAPDLETFHAQHPGMLQQNGLGLGLQGWPRTLRGFGGPIVPGWKFDWDVDSKWLQPRALQPLFPRAQDPQDQLGAPDAVPTAPPPAGKRLGIAIRPELPAELREHLELEDGVGLMVESVQPGTLAESLGLLRGDIIVKIADKSIGAAVDVQEALGGIEAGKKVEVKFLRKGVEKTATTTKTEAAEPAKKVERLERRQSKAGESIR